MRIYFLSKTAAALKLNGAYMGIIDSFERFVDVDGKDKVLCEAVPDGELLPVNFFIDEKLFTCPPDFLDVYLSDGDAVIYISRYEPRGGKLCVIAQTRFENVLCTLFENGGKIYLNCEGEKCNLYELSDAFKKGKFTRENVDGHPVLLLEGKGALAAISAEGKRVFYNPAESWSCKNGLNIVVAFSTCAGCKAECLFNFDGREMTLNRSVTREYMPPNEEVKHFAFFESVLTRGDFARYLCDDLKKKSSALFSFLGEFVDVALPYSRFYERHGDVKAAGLVYPKAKNLFEIKYFAVDMTDGEITNIYEVE